jgi:hypothetical protein
MNRHHKFLIIIVGFAGLAFCQSFAGTFQSNRALHSAEQLQVYRDFIDSFSKTNFKSLSDRTFPLDLSSLGKDAACLQGLQLEDTKGSANTTHQLEPEVLREHSIQLVDPRAELAILEHLDADAARRGSEADAPGMTKDPGVLALSEIVFDKSHHFAVLKYVFLCGSHCNSGAILVLEKIGSQWSAKSRRACTFAINRDNPL